MLWKTISMRRASPLFRPTVVMSTMPPRERARSIWLFVPSLSFVTLEVLLASQTGAPQTRFHAALTLGKPDPTPRAVFHGVLSGTLLVSARQGRAYAEASLSLLERARDVVRFRFEKQEEICRCRTEQSRSSCPIVASASSRPTTARSTSSTGVAPRPTSMDFAEVK